MIKLNKAVIGDQSRRHCLRLSVACMKGEKNIYAPKAQNDGRTAGRPNPQAAPKSLATTSSRSELDCLLPFWGDPLMG